MAVDYQLRRKSALFARLTATPLWRRLGGGWCRYFTDERHDLYLRFEAAVDSKTPPLLVYRVGLYSVTMLPDGLFRVLSGTTGVERYHAEDLARWRADVLAEKSGFGEPRK